MLKKQPGVQKSMQALFEQAHTFHTSMKLPGAWRWELDCVLPEFRSLAKAGLLLAGFGAEPHAELLQHPLTLDQATHGQTFSLDAESGVMDRDLFLASQDLPPDRRQALSAGAATIALLKAVSAYAPLCIDRRAGFLGRFYMEDAGPVFARRIGLLSLGVHAFAQSYDRKESDDPRGSDQAVSLHLAVELQGSDEMRYADKGRLRYHLAATNQGAGGTLHATTVYMDATDRMQPVANLLSTDGEAWVPTAAGFSQFPRLVYAMGALFEPDLPPRAESAVYR